MCMGWWTEQKREYQIETNGEHENIYKCLKLNYDNFTRLKSSSHLLN